MYYKAERNFKCNDVTKQKGEFISSEEVELIGGSLDQLLQNGVLLKLDLHPEMNKPMEEKPKRKRSTKTLEEQ